MASKNIADWQADVLKYVKISGSDTLDIIDGECLETLRDFCRYTALWRITLDPISSVSLQGDYVFGTDWNTPAGEGDNVPYSLQWAKYKEDGEDDDQYFKLEMIDEDTENDILDYSAWEFDTAPNPDSIYMDPDNTLHLHPIPEDASTDGLLLRVIVQPTPEADKVPKFIWDDYKRIVTYGTVSRLLRLTNKPWSNAELADYFMNKYQKRRNNLKYDRKTGKTARKMRVRATRSWFGGSRSSDWVY